MVAATVFTKLSNHYCFSVYYKTIALEQRKLKPLVKHPTCVGIVLYFTYVRVNRENNFSHFHSRRTNLCLSHYVHTYKCVSLYACVCVYFSSAHFIFARIVNFRRGLYHIPVHKTRITKLK